MGRFFCHNCRFINSFGQSRFVVLDIVIALRLIYTRPLEKYFSHMLGGTKVRHMTPDFDILSISGVVGTCHILVASGSFRVLPGRQLTSRRRQYTPSHYDRILQISRNALFLQLRRGIVSCSLPCVAWSLSSVACSLSTVFIPNASHSPPRLSSKTS